MKQLITIEQLLNSVDLDFEPRWVTQDKYNSVRIWGDTKPKQTRCGWEASAPVPVSFYPNLKLTEFSDKLWTKCIYEVPRKTTGNIEKLGKLNLSGTNMTMNQNAVDTVVNTLNQVIDVVNKHIDIIQQIGEWGSSKGEFLWCETLTKFEPSVLNRAK